MPKAQIKEHASPESALTDWVNNYSDVLYASAVKRVSDEGLAIDLVQETFMAAFQSYGRFEYRSKPKTWLTSILKNKIMDHFRQVYRRKETSIEGDFQMFNEDGTWKTENIPTPWEETHLLDNPEFIDVFDSCVEALPERWASSIRIKYLDSDIKLDDLGVSKANYWKMLERARTQLRNCLEVNWVKPNK
ncbi:MAG: sigma-70 family RNA polymerase sigma factor [Bacteroidetes bacterium]|jgi:RNA polymerase sigma-70 factor (ECF subfamily)|nr:sigma-70 family RNA polymerase sigma factor [Bacteroidota bacterium]